MILLISISAGLTCSTYRINNPRAQQLGVPTCFYLFHDFNNYTFLDGNFYQLINSFSPYICHFLKRLLVAGFFLLMINKHLGNESDGAIYISALPSMDLPQVTHG